MRLAAAGLLLLCAAQAGMAAPHAQNDNDDPGWWVAARSFLIPSESMLPTLPVGSHIMAHRKRPDQIRRGNMIVFRVKGATWVKRVAGLPGDRIAMHGGIVRLNGEDVAQHLLGHGPIVLEKRTRRLLEKFPGEIGSHQILDTGDAPYDTLPERRVAPGTVFVLGDNRDNSMDSRVPRSENEGIAPVRIADIYGIVDSTATR